MVDSAEHIDIDSPGHSTGGPSVKTERRIYIRIPNTDDPDALTSLKSAIDKTPGLIPVVLVVGQTDDKQIIKLPALVEPDDEFMSFARDKFGEPNVKYQ